MGWKLKGLALIIAISSALAGIWILAIPLFIYPFWGFLFRSKKRNQIQVNVRYPDNRQDSPAAATAKPSDQGPQGYAADENIGRGPEFPKRYIIGGVLILLSLVALGQRGTFSPIVFGASGLVVLFWDRISGSTRFSTFRPVRESVVFRKPMIPFLWFALAEVKFATRNVATALASIDERLLVMAYDKPAIYVLFWTVELSHGRAETKLVEKMRETEMMLATLGSYLLPLDSEKVIDVMGFSTRRVKVDPNCLSHSVFTLPYEILSIKPKDGYIDSAGIFVRKEDRRSTGEIRIPSPGQKPARPPLLWEILRLVERKLSWPDPDPQTAFLAGLYATRAETIGERIVEAEETANPSLIVVKSMAGPPVELSKAQLRALVRVYASTVT